MMMPMVLRFTLLFILSLYLTPLRAGNDDGLRERMLRELDSIRNCFEARYAPAQWKKQSIGWDLGAAIDAAKRQVAEAENLSQKDFQRILRRFFKSAQDYHVEIYFHSTEASFLPFRLRGAQGRYFVTSVNEKAPNYQSIPVKVGDEILSFDGLPTDEAIKYFQKQEMYDHGTPTETGLAETFLTSRVASLAHMVPKGAVSIEVRHRADGQVRMYQAKWDYKEERICQRSPSRQGTAADAEKGLGEESFFKREMSTPLYHALSLHPELQTLDQQDSDDGELLASGSMMPIGGTTTEVAAALQGAARQIWQANSRFYKACIYQTEKNQKVGYLRLPNYYGSHIEIADLGNIIASFQSNSDVMIIDQTTNPGGYFFYMFAIASMLSDQPLWAHPHEQTLTQADVAFAIRNLSLLETINNSVDARRKLGNTIQGLHIDNDMANNFRNHFAFIIDQWSKGHNVSVPYALMGIEQIKPHPRTRYTKPIIILTNSLSYSCADFLPAMLQDNGRALVIGTPTAGAGGFVLRTTMPNRFGVSNYTYTASMGYRFDQKPLEGNGVKPDIYYEVTAEDLQNNFKGYMAVLQAAVDQLLDGKPSVNTPVATPRPSPVVTPPPRRPAAQPTTINPSNDEQRRNAPPQNTRRPRRPRQPPQPVPPPPPPYDPLPPVAPAAPAEPAAPPLPPAAPALPSPPPQPANEPLPPELPNEPLPPATPATPAPAAELPASEDPPQTGADRP